MDSKRGGPLVSVGEVSEERLKKEGDLGASLSGGMLSKLQTIWHRAFTADVYSLKASRLGRSRQDRRDRLKLITCKVLTRLAIRQPLALL